MPRLTKRIVDQATPQAKERWVWDTELKGFGLRVYPDGRKLYACQYRTAGGRRGRTRRVTLGAHGVLTPDAAREQAKKTLARAALGEDPSAERQAARTVPTMRELWQRYLDVHGPKKKTSSLRNDKQLWRDVLNPALGRLTIRDVSRGDVRHPPREPQRHAIRRESRPGVVFQADVPGGAQGAARRQPVSRARTLP